MGLLKGGNPAISEKTFDKVRVYNGEQMTVSGTMNKFGIMLLMLLGGASFTWSIFFKSGAEAVMPWMFGSAIAGLVVALIIIFKQSWAPYLALAYAMFEGLFLGAVSAIYSAAFAESYPGIVMQAVMLTFGCAGLMFVAYRTGLIKATNTFKRVVIMATGAIALLYLASMIMNLFGAQMPYLHDNGPIGIGISVVIVAVAALNLILDFDMIDGGAANGAPKYFEWYAAFGLMVTMVWLYLEILRLLSKLSSRD